MARIEGHGRGHGEAFAFSGDAAARQWENIALLWAAPWRAWWAIAFETLDPENYRR